MANPAPTYLIDISRLISRAGRGVHTGIDRVEWAYVQHFLKQSAEVHFLSKSLGGFVLLDRHGMENLLPYLNGEKQLGHKDVLSHLGRRQSEELKRAESTMRRLSVARVLRSALPTMLQRSVPPGFIYLNVGHINQASSTLAGIQSGGAKAIGLMVHDIIPIEFPEFARPSGKKKFEKKLRGAVSGADFVIYNSTDTASRTERVLRSWDVELPSVTLHLGLDANDKHNPGRSRSNEHPYFVALGTIEPRKNHLLLLNVWRRFYETLPEGEIPHLHIVGRRGWENENIIDQLERAPFMGRTVFERGTLPDNELSPLLAGAKALLFPSFAEGYGYPLVEALTFGSSVIASDLEVFREVGKDHAIYLDPLDGPRWAEAILQACHRHKQLRKTYVAPSWKDHFEGLKAFLEHSGWA